MNRKLLSHVLVLAVFTILSLAAGFVQAQDNPWVASVYNNRTFEGDPVEQFRTEEIQFDWTNNPPSNSVNPNRYSVRFRKNDNFPAGNYQFTIDTDSAVRFIVDGEVLIDRLDRVSPGTHTAQATLDQGQHTLILEYVQAGGPAYVFLETDFTPISQGPGGGGGDQFPTADNVNWEVEYYNNTNLNPPVVYSEVSRGLDFNWGSGSPNPSVRSDNFSARMYTEPFFNREGTYRFIAEADDAVRVIVDGDVIIDTFGQPQPGTTVFGDKVISYAPHEVTVEYIEYGGNAYVNLEWEYRGNANPVQPTAVPPPAPTATPQPSGPRPPLNVQWNVQYFDNRGFNPPVAVSQITNTLSYDWGTGSPVPGMQSDNFSVRFTGNSFFNGNTYRFYVFADDGVRLTIDGQAVVLNTLNQPRPGQLLTVDRQLSPGTHTIELEYRELEGDAYVHLDWADLATNPSGPVFPGIGGVTNQVWTAEYYNNQTLFGNPVAVITENSPNHDWGFGAPFPSMNPDHFSARWRGNFSLNGTYRVNIKSDDGVRFYVNGQQIINEWHDAANVVYSSTFVVPAGTHDLMIEYYENTGTASLQFDIQQVSGPGQETSGLWLGQYYSNPQLSGTPTVEQVEYGPSHDWGTGSPAPNVPADNFSARFSTNQNLSSGQYQFQVQADDGVRVFVDNVLIIDEWHTAQANVYGALLSLPQGPRRIVVEYFEQSGGAYLNYAMTRIGDYNGVPSIPPSNNSQGATGSTATVTAVTLNVRNQPDASNSQVIAKIEGGETYPVIGKNADSSWWQIQSPDFGTGWVYGDFVNVTNQNSVPVTNQSATAPIPPTTGYTLIATDTVVIRSAPSSQAGVIGNIPRNARADIIGRNSSSTYYYILYNGTAGWISSDFAQLQFGVTNSQLPVYS